MSAPWDIASLQLGQRHQHRDPERHRSISFQQRADAVVASICMEGQKVSLVRRP